MKTPNLNIRNQKGATTLVIAIILLVILSLIVAFSTNVAFFEAKTTKNENRAKIVEQAAEYSLNLAGEYLKAKRSFLISKTAGNATTGGWLASATNTGKKWLPCPSGALASTHPCNAEVNTARRAELYFYTEDGSNPSILPYRDLTPDGSTGPELEGKGVAFDSVRNTGGYAVTTNVRALLCRIDASLTVPACKLTPSAGNQIAVTLVAEVQMSDESSASVIKETWATYNPALPSSSAALSAAGGFDGTGNVTIVTAPNGGGYGLPVSIWSGGNVSVDGLGGGSVASVSSCYVGEFMKGSAGYGDIQEAKQVCPQNGNSPPCHCPSSAAAPNDWLSGHPNGGARREGIDILDRDGVVCAVGDKCVPDIKFFPGLSKVPGGGWAPFDQAGVLNDDSLFEWIFGVDYVVADRSTNGVTLTNCGAGSENCAAYALVNELGATQLADCSSLDANSSGLFYVTGNCSITGQVGSANSPALVVTFGEADLGPNSVLYGMLFAHSNNILADNTSVCNPNCKFKMNGGTVFGSLVIEGDIDMSGNPIIIYDDISISADVNTLPSGARFARVPGSWLDFTTGF